MHQAIKSKELSLPGLKYRLGANKSLESNPPVSQSSHRMFQGFYYMGNPSISITGSCLTSRAHTVTQTA